MAGRYTEYPEYKSTDEVWLGNIPANWKVVQTKYIADSVNTGGTPKELSSFTEEPEVFWFSPSDFHNGHSLEKANKYVTWRSVNSKDSKIYRANSVLVIGIGATLGKVAHCSKAFGPRPVTFNRAFRLANAPFASRCATIFSASDGPSPAICDSRGAEAMFKSTPTAFTASSTTAARDWASWR